MTQGQTRPQRLCPLGVWLLLRSPFPFPQATPSSPVRLCHWGSQGGGTHRSFQKLPEPPPAHPMVLWSVSSCTWARPLLPHLQTRSPGMRKGGPGCGQGVSSAPRPAPPRLPGAAEWMGWGRAPPGPHGLVPPLRWLCVCTCIYVLVALWICFCVFAAWSQESLRLEGAAVAHPLPTVGGGAHRSQRSPPEPVGSGGRPPPGP